MLSRVPAATMNIHTTARLSKLLLITFGSLATALGLMVVVGWHTHNEALIHVRPNFVTMVYNAALGFILCGSGVIAIALSRPRWASTGGVLASAIGLVTLVEYGFRVDLRIDRLLMTPYLNVANAFPGRMAISTAAFFFLAGAAIGLLGLSKRFRYRPLIVGIVGAACTIQGLVAFAGYFTGVASMYVWGDLARMAIHTAFGAAMVGTSLLIIAWRDQGPRQEDRESYWLPLLVGLAIVTIALSMWQALIVQQRMQGEHLTKVHAANLRNTIAGHLQIRMQALHRMAERWEQLGKPSQESWEENARLNLDDFDGLIAVWWTARARQESWTAQPIGTQVPLDVNTFFDRQKSIATPFRDHDAARITAAIDLGERGKAFGLYVPVFENGELSGFIVGAQTARPLVDEAAAEENLEVDYAIAVLDGQTQIYGPQVGDPRSWEEKQKTEMVFSGAVWQIWVWPQTGAPQSWSSVPTATLIVGLLAALLLSGSVRLAQNARRNARSAEKANLGLQEEMAERRRAEEAVRDLSTLMRTILDSANYTIISVDARGNIKTFNKGAERLLGYTAEEMIDKQTPAVIHDSHEVAERARVLSEELGTTIEPGFDAMAAKARSGGFDENEWTYVRKDGSRFPAMVSVAALWGANKEIRGYVAVGSDISESKRADLERQVISEIVQGVITTSNLAELLALTHRLISQCLYAENCFITLHDHATGIMHYEYWVDQRDPVPQSRPFGGGFAGHVMTTGKPLLLTDEVEDELCEQAGVKRIGSKASSWLGVPLRTNSRTIGALVVQNYEHENAYDQRDVDFLTLVGDQLALAIERKRIEGDLKTNERLMSEAQRIARLGSWEHDAASGKVTWSPEEWRIFGLDEREFGPSFEEFLAMVHPDDQHLVKSIKDRLDQADAEPATDYRIIRPDGTIRVLRANCRVLRDELGLVVRITATDQDITEQKKVETELKQRELELNEAQHIAQTGSWEWDVASNKTNWSDALFSIYGIEPEDLVPSFEGYLNLVHPDDRERVAADVTKVLSERQGCVYEHRIVRPDKTVRHHHVNLKVALGQDGQPSKLFGTAQDITDRIYLEDELKQARDVAIESARSKSEFLANMSHEIRTPMNGVIGMTGLLLDTNLDDDQRDCAETIRSSGEALLTIINDILDFSKIEAGKLQFDVVDFDLRNAVEGTVESLAERASEKHLEFASFVHSDLPTALCGDPGRLRQILTNLTGNALKFTERGEVIVSAEKEFESDAAVMIRFSVRDTGIGISEATQQKLFQAFTQADGSTTRKYGGTGLGLSISKQLVELMGGKIGVTSEPGKGSTFWFTARFDKQPASAVPATPNIETLAGLRVLLVDDNETNRKILAHQVTSWGMIHDEADSAARALTLLRDAAASGGAYDLAILDLIMPDVDGFELARMIKSDPKLSSIPVVLLTSAGQRGDGTKARDAGIAAYLTKPVRQSHLFDCLITILSTTRKPAEVVDLLSPSTLVTRHTLQEARKMSPKLILLAEDNIVNQKIAVRQLQKLGYRADVVADGREAVEALSRIPYDLVFMDCQMPEMDGYEASAEIRRIEGEAKHTPIVAMTAHALQGDREKCLAAGMDDYISKPVKVEELIRVLDCFFAEVSNESVNRVEIPSDAPAVDLARFHEAMGESPEEFAEILEIYVAHMSESLDQLDAALVAQDAGAVESIAHNCAGTSANCGMTAVVAPLRELEQAGHTARLEQTSPLVARTRLGFESIQEFLKDRLLETA